MTIVRQWMLWCQMSLKPSHAVPPLTVFPNFLDHPDLAFGKEMETGHGEEMGGDRGVTK